MEDSNMDDYLLRGILGATALAGAAIASAYYFSTRPVPQIPLVPLDSQSPILEVSTYIDTFNITSIIITYLYYRFENFII